MKRNLAVFAFAFLILHSVSRADQLAWISGPDAEKAVRHLQEGIAGRKGEPYYIVSYCSQCDQERVEVWEVAKAVKEAIPNEDFFQVRISGRRVLRSAELIREGKYSEPIHYEATAGDAADLIHQEVDLAYIYAPSPDGSFQCLGKTLGLECSVLVERIIIAKEETDKIRSQPEVNVDPPPTFDAAVLKSLQVRDGLKYVSVSMASDGSLSIAGRPVTWEEFAGLSAVQGLPSPFGVIITVEENARYKFVKECMKSLAKQKIIPITFVAAKQRQETPGGSDPGEGHPDSPSAKGR